MVGHAYSRRGVEQLSRRKDSVSVIVCTTGSRPTELFRTIHGIATQTVHPIEAIVVDQSGGIIDIQGLANVVSPIPLKIAASSIKSLTNARNLGIANLGEEAEWVLFLDDDAVIETGFIEALHRGSERHLAARVLFGSIRNLEPTPTLYNLVALRMGLPCHGNGLGFRVLRSSKKTMEVLPAKDMSADWSTGCAFMVRRTVFTEVRFDPQMMGYCLGEDTDFSFQIGRKWPESVYCISDAYLTHEKAPSGRLGADRLTRMRTLYGFYLFCKHRPLGLSAMAFWSSEFFFTIAVLLSSLLRHTQNPYRFVPHLASYLDLLREYRRIGKGDLSGVNKILFP